MEAIQSIAHNMSAYVPNGHNPSEAFNETVED